VAAQRPTEATHQFQGQVLALSARRVAVLLRLIASTQVLVVLVVVVPTIALVRVTQTEELETLAHILPLKVMRAELQLEQVLAVVEVLAVLAVQYQLELAQVESVRVVRVSPTTQSSIQWEQQLRSVNCQVAIITSRVVVAQVKQEIQAVV
jgi:hypothetical protein